MKLKAFEIEGATVFCNEKQIEEAGSLEAAAKKHYADHKARSSKGKKKEEGERPDRGAK